MELLLLLGLFGVLSSVDFSSNTATPNDAVDDPEQDGSDPALTIGPLPDPEPQVLNGSNADDTLIGAASGLTLNGFAGDDTLEGFGGDDSLYGGEGNDLLVGGRGADLFYGGNGDDLLEDIGGMNTLFGGSGNDRLHSGGLTGNDGPHTSSFYGGAGDDTLEFQDGSTVSGGAGADAFDLSDRLSDTLVSRIEDFDPDEDSLTIYLEAANGDGGGFALVARPDGLGRDLYLGEDLVAEILSAKPFTLADMSIVVGLTPTPDGVTTFRVEPQDAPFNISVLDSDGDDHIISNSSDDYLYSYGGSDLLEGGGGNDILFGQGGRVGSFGDDDTTIVTQVFVETDTLLGGAGDDELWADNGGVMTGGEGSDVFNPRLYYRDPSIGALFQPALITDFNPAEDVLVLGIDGSAYAAPENVQIRAFADGTGADVLVRGLTVARVIGGQSLTLDDIQFEDPH